jgi:cytochrome P450
MTTVEPEVGKAERAERVTDGTLGVAEVFDPFDDPHPSGPYDLYRRARGSAPVFYSARIDHWVVSRYEDIKRICLDPVAFSNANTLTPVMAWPPAATDLLERLTPQGVRLRPSIGVLDPPDHTRIRAFVKDAFGPRRMTWLKPRVRKLIAEKIDGMRERCDGRADIVAELFRDAPAEVLYMFLGIPARDIKMVKAWSSGRLLLLFGCLSIEELCERIPSFMDNALYCFDLVDELERAPGDDYISELLKKLHNEQPDGIDKSTIALLLFTLLTAGHETTSSQAGNGLRRMLEHRDSWQAIVDEPKLIPNAVEEIMRFDSSVITWRRVTTKPVEIAGVAIPKDSQILMLLGSANRDETTFEDADSFDIFRSNAGHHLSFTAGVHYCLGAPLARLELRIMLEELSRRMPSLTLVEDQQVAISRDASHLGPKNLWVRWD